MNTTSIRCAGAPSTKPPFDFSSITCVVKCSGQLLFAASIQLVKFVRLQVIPKKRVSAVDPISFALLTTEFPPGGSTQPKRKIEQRKTNNGRIIFPR